MFSHGHLLGTDRLGRDMLTRAAYGARASLEIAFLANLSSVGLGVIVGLVAGFYRGWIEHVLMRITDMFLSIPTVISGLALAAVARHGPDGHRDRRDRAVLGLDGARRVRRDARAAQADVRRGRRRHGRAPGRR